jgi:hypothetical protein
MSRWGREHRLVASAICGIIWLIVAGPASGAEHRFDGVYAGKRSLTKGSGSDCPTKEDVSVTIHGETLTFTNSALKNYTIAFYPRPDGSFVETHVDEGGDTVEIRGHIIEDVIEADVYNPPCEHHWRLKKK